MVPFEASKRNYRNVRLTHEQKLVAIYRVKRGESKAAVARDICVPESTLRGWFKNWEKIHNIVLRQNKFKETNDQSLPADQISHNTNPTKSSNGDNDLLKPMDLTTLNRPLHEQRSQSCDLYANGNQTNQSKRRYNTPASWPPCSILMEHGINDTSISSNGSKEGSTSSTGSLRPKTLAATSQSQSPRPVATSTPQPPCNQSKQSTLYLQLHNFNQAVMGQIANGSPSSVVGELNFNFNTPDELHMPQNTAVQPTQTANLIASSTRVTKPESINKDINVGEMNSWNKTNRSCDNNNNGSVADNKENLKEMTEALVAIGYAEKFAKWFENYSDPTLTQQDVMRFEQLLGKVKKIVDRRRNGTVMQKIKHQRK